MNQRQRDRHFTFKKPPFNAKWWFKCFQPSSGLKQAKTEHTHTHTHTTHLTPNPKPSFSLFQKWQSRYNIPLTPVVIVMPKHLMFNNEIKVGVIGGWMGLHYKSFYIQSIQPVCAGFALSVLCWLWLLGYWPVSCFIIRSVCLSVSLSVCLSVLLKHFTVKTLTKFYPIKWVRFITLFLKIVLNMEKKIY